MGGRDRDRRGSSGGDLLASARDAARTLAASGSPLGRAGAMRGGGPKGGGGSSRSGVTSDEDFVTSDDEPSGELGELHDRVASRFASRGQGVTSERGRWAGLGSGGLSMGGMRGAGAGAASGVESVVGGLPSGSGASLRRRASTSAEAAGAVTDAGQGVSEPVLGSSVARGGAYEASVPGRGAGQKLGAAAAAATAAATTARDTTGKMGSTAGGKGGPRVRARKPRGDVG